MQNMSRFVIAIATVAALCVDCVSAEASMVVTVDKSAQRLSVAIDGSQRYQWPVSTARRGYSTPNGSYRPERLARKWFSRKYDWSPMPYSIFSMAVTPFTAVTRSLTSAVRHRTAASGCVHKTLPSYSRWSKSTCARRPSSLQGKRRRPQAENGSGNIKRLSRQCPLWVKSGHMRCKRHVCFTPRKRTCAAH